MLISILEKLNLFGLTDLITGSNEMRGSVHEEKNSKLKLLLLLKLPSRKLELDKVFLSRGFLLISINSSIRPCMEYCCHVWAGGPRCYLDMLDKLQKRM